jgi:hypothetical protein
VAHRARVRADASAEPAAQPAAHYHQSVLHANTARAAYDLRPEKFCYCENAKRMLDNASPALVHWLLFAGSAALLDGADFQARQAALQPIFAAAEAQVEALSRHGSGITDSLNGSFAAGACAAIGPAAALPPELRQHSLGLQSAASFDDATITESPGSSPRSRSSWAPSLGHGPPSRGPSASSMSRLRRPPRATSSGLRSALVVDSMQPSFTDSVTNTNTTNSSEAGSPRHRRYVSQCHTTCTSAAAAAAAGPPAQPPTCLVCPVHWPDTCLLLLPVRSSSVVSGTGGSGSAHQGHSRHSQQQQQPLPSLHHEQQLVDSDWPPSRSVMLDNSSQALPQLDIDTDGDVSAGSHVANAASHLAELVGGSMRTGGGGGHGAASATYAASSVSGLGVTQRASSFTSRPGGRGPIEDAHSGKMSLLQLQRAIEKIMVSDGEMYAKLQAGLKGINSLARETDNLRVKRDVTGATCINQYVVVKTLGRGSFGKVKLVLNTLDGQLYAVKVR